MVSALDYLRLRASVPPTRSHSTFERAMLDHPLCFFGGPKKHSTSGGCMPTVVDNVDTLIVYVKLRQDFPLELEQQVDVLKDLNEVSQDAERRYLTAA